MSNDQNTDRLNIQVHKAANDSPSSSPKRIPDSGVGSNRQNFKDSLNYQDCLSKNEEIKDVISGLDVKLNRVLAKQEYEYLKGYNIYVKRKERELRDLIEKLNDKNSNNDLKDQKIQNLEKTIQSIQQDQIKMQKDKDDQGKKIKYWQSKATNMEQERNFLQSQVLEAKRQNKLLKMAITRLQTQMSNTTPAIMSGENDHYDKGETFLTESQQPVNIPIDTIRGGQSEAKEKDAYGISTMQGSKEETAAHTSYIGAQQSYLTAGGQGLNVGMSVFTQNEMKKERAKTRSPQSRYRHIPTENLKFQKFMDLIWQSKMSRDGQKTEITNYVQVLETNYTDTIRDLKDFIKKEETRNKKLYFEKVNDTVEKSELESLFVECIEEVRKDIMKRRLKNEIYNKKKFQQIDKNTEEAREFEMSLLKLAQLAKGRVKINEFTSKDRGNLLDLFVNNERTLLKIYEILFPHRATPNAGAGVSTQMVKESGNGVYGENAVRSLKSRGGELHYDRNRVGQISETNHQILELLPPYRGEFDSNDSNVQHALPSIMGINKSMHSTTKQSNSQQKMISQTESNGKQLRGSQQHEKYKGPVQGMVNTQGLQPSHLGVFSHDNPNFNYQT